MPKKTKTKAKKSRFPFAHPTRHGKPHWRKLLYMVMLGAFGLVLLAAIIAQFMYDRFLWDYTQEQAAFKMGVLIKTAVDSLDEIKTDLGPDGRVEELRLQLPPKTEGVDDVRYLYSKESKSVQITDRELVLGKTSSLLVQRNIEDLFETVPSAQACIRGFALQFSDKPEVGSDLKLSGTKKLNDGRTLYVYREPACNVTYGIDELESYLLRTQSY